MIPVWREFVRGPLRTVGWFSAGVLLVTPYAVMLADHLGYF